MPLAPPPVTAGIIFSRNNPIFSAIICASGSPSSSQPELPSMLFSIFLLSFHHRRIKLPVNGAVKANPAGGVIPVLGSHSIIDRVRRHGFSSVQASHIFQIKGGAEFK